MLTDLGKAYALKVLTGQLSVETFDMGLYTAISSPWSNATVLGNITEVAAGGYARQGTTGWAAPTLTGGHDGDTVATQVTFANTSGSPVVAVGFFYITHTTGVLYGGADFTSPLTIPATVGTLTITPELQSNVY